MCISPWWSMMFILMDIGIAPPKHKSGLEFWTSNFPDSLTELFTSAISVAKVERVDIMVYNFFEHIICNVNTGIVLNKVPEATEKDLVEYCKKQLAASKVPKRIFFADELPRKRFRGG